MTCTLCGRTDWPSILIQPMVVTGGADGLEYIPSDPLCALQVMRDQMGDPDFMFQGDRTVDLYNRALAWREEHP